MLTKEILEEAIRYSIRMENARYLDRPLACACIGPRNGEEFCGCMENTIENRTKDIEDFLCERPDPRGLKGYKEKLLENIPIGLSKIQYYKYLRKYCNMNMIEAYNRTKKEFENGGDF